MVGLFRQNGFISRRMEKPPEDFDLKLMPDWLKDGPAKNPYADYEVREERPRRDAGGDRPRPPRGPKRDDQKRDGRPRGQDQRPPQRSGQNFSRPTDGASSPSEAPRPAAEAKPLPVRIEFLPEGIFIESIAKQVRTTHRAYPLFDLARMFLEKPERHRVRLASTETATPLFQLGEDGPVALDRQTLERGAFEAMKSRFYEEETTQREPLKGNFANVARCRLSGVLLGPTNYHGYQPAVRKLYDERFSRRMPFHEYQREIEVVTSAEAVETWKNEARSVTVFKTREETDPQTFASAAEVEQHFRKTHLEALVRTGASFEISGETSRNLSDRRVASAVRQAWEKERGFPAQMMFHLRQQLGNAGLHIFKHRKRMQFVSLLRPEPFTDKNFSPNIAEILGLIEHTPKCTRGELANRILGGREEDPELPKKKAALASDLHWLIDAGRVIEFHNGWLELPLEARAAAAEEAAKPPAAATSAAPPPAES